MRLTEKKLLTALRKHNYKLTPQRREIVKIITSAHEHLTPATIYEITRRTHPDIGLVTIYRTLELLAGLGLVCELHADSRHRSYTTGIPQHHHHLICSGCGKVVDFAGRHLEILERSLSKESGFRIDDHLLEFIGLCSACQKTS